MTTSTMSHDEVIPFSRQLWESTASAHGSAETSTNMARLVKGELSRDGFVAMQRQLYFLYRTLEEEMTANLDDPIVKAFYDERLDRTAALTADLLALTGSTPSADEIDPVTAKFCELIRSTAKEWAPGLIAHHYTRYLGDLSGGQQIRRVVEGAYGIGKDSGTAFFYFDELGNLVEFKNQYRSALDEIGFDADQRERFIEEVHASYALSSALVAELEL